LLYEFAAFLNQVYFYRNMAPRLAISLGFWKYSSKVSHFFWLFDIHIGWLVGWLVGALRYKLVGLSIVSNSKL
jgi:hypothetical protein